MTSEPEPEPTAQQSDSGSAPISSPPVWGAGVVTLRDEPPVPRGRWAKVGGFFRGLGLVLLSIAAFVAIWGLTMRGDPDGGDYSAPEVTPGPTVTAVGPGFAGRWVGSVPTLNDAASVWVVRIDLSPGATEARVEVVKPGCSRRWVIRDGRADYLDLTAPGPAPSAACPPPGSIRLTLRHPQRLEFEWTDAARSEHQAAGTLAPG
jgi:hypothetical protein